MTEQRRLIDYSRDKDPSEIAAAMSERERIEFIRKNGTEAMQDGLEAVFDGNKYKPVREKYWKEQLKKGRKMVRCILKKRRNSS